METEECDDLETRQQGKGLEAEAVIICVNSTGEAQARSAEVKKRSCHSYI